VGNLRFVRRPALRLWPPPAPSMHRIPKEGLLFPLSPSFSLSRYLSFELYPLNLQLWGAASMRDTFSRKFARRILKPRGKQDQYQRASREQDTLRPRVLWLVALSFLSSWLSCFSPAAGARSDDTPSQGRVSRKSAASHGPRRRRIQLSLCSLRASSNIGC